MPRIRLYNPRRKRSSRRRRSRRRNRSQGAVMRAFKSGMKEARKLMRRNRAANGGELVTMANKRKRRRRRRRNVYHRRRRRNPIVRANPRRRYRRRRNPFRRYRRRRNPIGLRGIADIGVQALWAIGGGVATRALPQMILKEKNAGAFGYLANAASAVLLSAAVSRFMNRSAGQAVLVGGAVMTAGRMIEDFLGKRLVEFAPGFAGLGRYGDSAYDLSGLYIASWFGSPTVSDPNLISAPPAMLAPAVAEVQAAENAVAGLGKYAGKYASRYAN